MACVGVGGHALLQVDVWGHTALRQLVLTPISSAQPESISTRRRGVLGAGEGYSVGLGVEWGFEGVATERGPM